MLGWGPLGASSGCDRWTVRCGSVPYLWWGGLDDLTEDTRSLQACPPSPHPRSRAPSRHQWPPANLSTHTGLRAARGGCEALQGPGESSRDPGHVASLAEAAAAASTGWRPCCQNQASLGAVPSFHRLSGDSSLGEASHPSPDSGHWGHGSEVGVRPVPGEHTGHEKPFLVNQRGIHCRQLQHRGGRSTVLGTSRKASWRWHHFRDS